jgi:hypothetical protein
MVNNSILSLLTHNDEVLSRTAKSGSVDVSVNSEKKPGLVKGRELARQVSENRTSVATFVSWQSSRANVSSWEHAFCLATIGYLTGQGILPGGLFREWEYIPPVDGLENERVMPDKIPDEVVAIGCRAAKIQKLDSLEERIGMIGGIEWDLVVGPAHPFYDGCGRVSRYFSALLCMWNRVPLVKFESRDQYFDAARQGRSVFQKYFGSQSRVAIRIL